MHLINKTLLLASAVLLFASCEKEINENPDYQLLGSSPTIEAARILSDITTGYDYHAGVISNYQYGNASALAEDDIYFSGTLPNQLVATIDSFTFTYNANLSNWFASNINYSNIFGENSTFTLTKDNESKSANRYLRAPFLISPLTSLPQVTIPRTGNNLTWQVDQSSSVNKVAIKYIKYKRTNGSFVPYEGDILIVDDIGTYNIDGLTNDSECDKISITGIAGNTLKYSFPDGTTLLSAASYDFHHYYFD